MPRLAGPVLVTVSLVILAVREEALRAIDVWTVAAVLSAAAGAFLWLRRWSGLRWMAAALPFWAVANQADWAMAAALGATFTGMVLVAVAPTLPVRRIRNGGQPLPALAGGPLIAVEPRSYPGGTRSRGMAIAAGALLAVCVVLLLVALRTDEADRAIPVGLGVASAIVGATFLFGNWFADRVRLRVDGHGLHGRVLFAEHSIAWSEVSGLAMRSLWFGGGMQVTYYCVRSPTREFAFPASMRGAEDLRRTIEQAAGVQWP